MNKVTRRPLKLLNAGIREVSESQWTKAKAQKKTEEVRNAPSRPWGTPRDKEKEPIDFRKLKLIDAIDRLARQKDAKEREKKLERHGQPF